MSEYFEYIDLHLHSNLSDGTYHPTDLIKEALKKKILFSITDHDSTLPPLSEASAIQGTELTCSWKGKVVHLLIYFKDVAALQPLIKVRKELRKTALKASIFLLNRKKCFDQMISLEDLITREDSPVFYSQTMLADFLYRKASSNNKQEIWDKYLLPNTETGVDINGAMLKSSEEILSREAPEITRIFQQNTIDLEYTVRHCTAAGALTVLAHPGKTGITTAEEILSKVPLWGIEVFYSKYAQNSKTKLIEAARRMALKHNLFMTAGTDSHNKIRTEFKISSHPELKDTLRELRHLGFIK